MAKQRYIFIDGAKIPVTEDEYRAFIRPVWRENERRKTRRKKELSLDKFKDDGFDVPEGGALLDEVIADKLLLETLMTALDRLTDTERGLIDALFYEDKSEREVARETGVSQNTVNYRKHKILDKLKKFIENF